MRRITFVALLAGVMVTLASGQTALIGAGVQVSGTPTAGNCAKWMNSTTLADAGTACGGGGGSSILYSSAAPASDLLTASGTFATTSSVITAGLLKNHSRIVIDAYGYFNAGGASPYVGVGVKLGAVTVVPSSASINVAGNSNNYWHYRWIITVTSAGTSGAVLPITQTEMPYNGGNISTFNYAVGTAVPVDTTAAQPVSITVAMSATTTFGLSALYVTVYP